MTRRNLLVGCFGGFFGAQLFTARYVYPIGGIADIVNDPLNLAQNTLTAIRSLVSNANEITQIQNQVVSLANEARQLLQLPLSLIAEIDQAFSAYGQLIAEGQGISYQIRYTLQQFEDLYKEGFGGKGTFMERAKRMIGQVRAAGRLAAQVTAVYDRICSQQARVGRLMAGSQAAVGQLQATQAGNQLMGILAEQQSSIQQILATDQRLKISEQMRQILIEEQAAMNAQAYLDGLGVITIRGPGEGRGFTLPQ